MKVDALLHQMEIQRQADFEMRMYDRIEKCEKRYGILKHVTPSYLKRLRKRTKYYCTKWITDERRVCYKALGLVILKMLSLGLISYRLYHCGERFELLRLSFCFFRSVC